MLLLEWEKGHEVERKNPNILTLKNLGEGVLDQNCVNAGHVYKS